MKYRKAVSRLSSFLPLSICLLFTILFSCIALNRYFSIQLFHYDFGIFAETIWGLSRFRIPILHHIDFGTIHFLGDHFNPSIVLLAPLFWIAHNIGILLFEQVIVTVASSYVLYRIARKHGVTHFSSVVVQLLYLLYAGIENPLITDWHTESTSGLLLLLFYYFFVFTNKRWVYLLFAIIFLGLKESNPVSFCLLLIPLFVTYAKKRKEIVLFGMGSVAYFFIVTKLFIPHFNKQAYFYLPKLPTTLPQLLQSLVRPEKYVFVIQSFLSFAFLPFLSGVWLLPVLGEMGMRILPVTSFFENFTLGMHYNVLLGIFLSLATIHGLKAYKKVTLFRNYEKVLVLLFLLFGFVIAREVTNSPIFLTTNPVFWKNLSPREDVFTYLTFVPKQGTIASQNNLLPYLLLRDEDIYMIRKNYHNYFPDIIIFDLSEGQNVNNFFPETRDFFIQEKTLLEKNPYYKRISVNNDNVYLFVKK